MLVQSESQQKIISCSLIPKSLRFRPCVFKDFISVSDCGSGLEVETGLHCERLPNNDLKISPRNGTKNVPEVLVGIHNVHKDYKYVYTNQ